MQASIDDILFPDSRELLASLAASTGPRFRALNKAVSELVDGYGMVAFTPLDITDDNRYVHAAAELLHPARLCVETVPRIIQAPMFLLSVHQCSAVRITKLAVHTWRCEAFSFCNLVHS